MERSPTLILVMALLATLLVAGCAKAPPAWPPKVLVDSGVTQSQAYSAIDTDTVQTADNLEVGKDHIIVKYEQSNKARVIYAPRPTAKIDIDQVAGEYVQVYVVDDPIASIMMTRDAVLDELKRGGWLTSFELLDNQQFIRAGKIVTISYSDVAIVNKGDNIIIDFAQGCAPFMAKILAIGPDGILFEGAPKAVDGSIFTQNCSGQFIEIAEITQIDPQSGTAMIQNIIPQP